MTQSIFQKYLASFKAIVKSIEERVNGKKTTQTYLYKDMLKKELSVDLKWETLSVNGAIVAADVVSLSSSLPLKSRGSVAQASGDIPKIGMKKQMTEKQLTDIDVLKARSVSDKILVDKIFDDTVSCILGIHEKLEYIFLKGLSSGVALVDDDTNTGTGIRVDYGYLDANKFGATTAAWSNPATATPIKDIKNVLSVAKARGVMHRVIMMDTLTFDNFAQSADVRNHFAFMMNFAGTNIPIPNLEQINSMMQKNFNITIVVVDRTVTIEKNGVRTTVSPWEANKVVFLENAKVGKLWYGILAEESRLSPKVMYEKSDFILVKKWSTEEPFAEFTSSQCLAIPAINNVDTVYILDCEELATDAQTEGDSTFDYDGNSYTKASVIAAINTAMGKTLAKSSNTDTKLLEYINALTKEQVAVFEANITLAV